MTLDEVLLEWNSKNRRMGCVAAARFVCERLPEFRPKRVRRYLPNGEFYEHVAPYSDAPSDGPVNEDEKLRLALRCWAKWYSEKLDRIAEVQDRGGERKEDYSGYEQDLFEALGCKVEG